MVQLSVPRLRKILELHAVIGTSDIRGAAEVAAVLTAPQDRSACSFDSVNDLANLGAYDGAYPRFCQEYPGVLSMPRFYALVTRAKSWVNGDLGASVQAVVRARFDELVRAEIGASHVGGPSPLLLPSPAFVPRASAESRLSPLSSVQWSAPPPVRPADVRPDNGLDNSGYSNQSQADRQADVRPDHELNSSGYSNQSQSDVLPAEEFDGSDADDSWPNLSNVRWFRDPVRGNGETVEEFRTKMSEFVMMRRKALNTAMCCMDGKRGWNNGKMLKKYGGGWRQRMSNALRCNKKHHKQNLNKILGADDHVMYGIVAPWLAAYGWLKFSSSGTATREIVCRRNPDEWRRSHSRAQRRKWNRVVVKYGIDMNSYVLRWRQAGADVKDWDPAF